MVNTTQVATSIPFDNSTNGYTAGDVQAAIEESKTGAQSTSAMVVYFGKGGDLQDAYTPSASGSTVTSNVTGPSFPRPIKVVGYALDSEVGRIAEAVNIILREKSDLGTDKYTIAKTSGTAIFTGWNLSGYTTYAAGEVMSIYVESIAGGKLKDGNISIWYVWND